MKCKQVILSKYQADLERIEEIDEEVIISQSKNQLFPLLTKFKDENEKVEFEKFLAVYQKLISSKDKNYQSVLQ